MADKKPVNKVLIISIFSIFIVALVILSYFMFFSSKDDINITTEKQVYTCPMHPQIISDHAGQCPICGMDLVLKTSASNDETLATDGINVTHVQLSPSQRVLANVQTVRTRMMEFSGKKTYNGYVQLNEQSFRHVNTRLMGKITRMYINFEGQFITKGQPAFEIYSPDLIATQKEFLLAAENYNKISESNSEFAIKQAQSLLDATRSRLRSFEMTPAQINRLESSGRVQENITIYSPASGIVTRKYVEQGHWLMEGQDVYDVADLSSVWVIANIYESEVPFIKQGQLAEIVTSSNPDRVFVSRIDFINPQFDPNTRTLEVRLNVTNPNYVLRPGMYVKVGITTYKSMSISVPKSAVIRTGEKNFVYIEIDTNIFEPREVNVLYEQEGYYALSGNIREGEIVVVSGGFLIDSETQIQQGFSTGHEGHDGNAPSSDEEFKINPDQNIFKDMDGGNRNNKNNNNNNNNNNEHQH